MSSWYSHLVQLFESGVLGLVLQRWLTAKGACCLLTPRLEVEQPFLSVINVQILHDLSVD